MELEFGKKGELRLAHLERGVEMHSELRGERDGSERQLRLHSG